MRKGIKLGILGLVGILGLFWAKPTLAKDYSIRSADFQVLLNRDGSADIVETRTYYFDGSYTWADEWINLRSKIKDQK